MNYIKTKLIEEYIIKNNLATEEFCKLCNIKMKELNKIFAGDYNLGISALFKIAKLIGKEVNELFN